MFKRSKSSGLILTEGPWSCLAEAIFREWLFWGVCLVSGILIECNNITTDSESDVTTSRLARQGTLEASVDPASCVIGRLEG